MGELDPVRTEIKTVPAVQKLKKILKIIKS